MEKLKIFCLSLNPKHLQLIKQLGYIPVGLGDKSFSKNWLTDKSLNGIPFKNRFYGEYTFHYLLWKNKDLVHDGWIGFCQYRKFWNSHNKIKLNNFSNFNELNNNVLKKISLDYDKYDSILVENFFVNEIKFSKLIKHNFKKIVFNPILIFAKEKRTIKFQFDMMHGEGNLSKAINLLPKKEKSDFNDFVNTEVSFNPHNMFICKNKNILFSYYDSIFPWLLDCEKIFGFNKLKGYGLQRIYAFLAERYLSYWFKKYTKFTSLPIIFKDLSDFIKN